MTQHAIRIGTAIVHYSTTDAVFRTLDGRPVTMEFHHYLGPSFFLNDDWWMPDEGTEEWGHLWRQFYGWWNAKNKVKREDLN